MTIVLKRLQARLQSSEDGFGDWSVVSPEQKHAVFKLLIKEESSLMVEYNTIRVLLLKTLSTVPVDEAKAVDLVLEALYLAERLTETYNLYINDYGAFTKSALNDHQKLYKKWLNPEIEYVAKEKQIATWERWFMAQSTMAKFVPRRLYFIRGRRLVLALVPLLKDFFNYASWVIWADIFVAPFLARLGTFFFLPRLAYDSFELFVYVLDYDKKMIGEQKLDPFTRFNAQWARLWPNITNDIAWTMSGMLLFFVFVGSLQPFAIYLSAAVQFGDVILASIRAYYDLSRFNGLIQEYRAVFPDECGEDIGEYLQILEKSIERERALRTLAIVNASVLFFSICLAIPVAVAIHPLLPVLGAVIAVLMTIINFEGRHCTCIIPASPSTDGLEKMLLSGRTVTSNDPSPEASLVSGLLVQHSFIINGSSDTAAEKTLSPSPRGITERLSAEDLGGKYNL